MNATFRKTMTMGMEARAWIKKMFLSKGERKTEGR